MPQVWSLPQEHRIIDQVSRLPLFLLLPVSLHVQIPESSEYKSEARLLHRARAERREPGVPLRWNLLPSPSLTLLGTSPQPLGTAACERSRRTR